MQYVGFDIHRRFTFYTRMDEAGNILGQGKLPNDRDAMAGFFARVGERPAVAMEATLNWYHLYDLLEELEIPVTLAHPLRTRAIAAARIKTDRIDSATLAHLLRANLVPAAYIPPREVRDLRELLRYRAALVSLRTAVKNRVHSILLKHGYLRIHADLFGKGGRAWLETLPFRPVYRRALAGLLAILDALQEQVGVATKEIEGLAEDHPQAEALRRLPGIGRYSAMLILAEIGDVRRFPSAKHLVSYAGLAPAVRASGGTVRTGRITKQGSKWLRWILTEAVKHAARAPGRYRDLYERLAKRKGRNVARIAVARALLSTTYNVLAHVQYVQ